MVETNTYRIYINMTFVSEFVFCFPHSLFVGVGVGTGGKGPKPGYIGNQIPNNLIIQSITYHSSVLVYVSNSIDNESLLNCKHG